MAEEEPQQCLPDDASDTSWSTQYTPKTGPAFDAPSSSSNNHHISISPSLTPSNIPLSTIPWPDKTYRILEKASRHALTLTDHRTRLSPSPSDSPHAKDSWLCVSRNHYTGFLHTPTQRYLGHDGKEVGGRIQCVSTKFDEWEFFVPRAHPSGGFQLLSPFWAKHLMLLVGTEGGVVERAHHGNTLWVFEEVVHRGIWEEGASAVKLGKQTF